VRFSYEWVLLREGLLKGMSPKVFLNLWRELNLHTNTLKRLIVFLWECGNISK